MFDRKLTSLILGNAYFAAWLSADRSNTGYAAKNITPHKIKFAFCSQIMEF